MTYMFILKCALKLVEEIILYYDARSKKHQNRNVCLSTVTNKDIPNTRTCEVGATVKRNT